MRHGLKARVLSNWWWRSLVWIMRTWFESCVPQKKEKALPLVHQRARWRRRDAEVGAPLTSTPNFAIPNPTITLKRIEDPNPNSGPRICATAKDAKGRMQRGRWQKSRSTIPGNSHADKIWICYECLMCFYLYFVCSTWKWTDFVVDLDEIWTDVDLDGQNDHSI